MTLNELLRKSVQAGASDIHLKLGQPPILRRDGALGPLEGALVLSEEALAGYLETVGRRSPDRLAAFHQNGDMDIAYQDEDLPRFRVNAYRQRGAISFAFRVIPRNVPTFEQLNLPKGVARLAEEHRGLVLVTGATGSGKTTTLASMLDHMNRTRRQHIITIEDPIEILHPDHTSIVNQREVGMDTESFGQALRRALRQDPDVILIGEMRDEETVQTALSAAETGHLVLSTIHTVDAPESINRMLDFFPPHQHGQIRSLQSPGDRPHVKSRTEERDHGAKPHRIGDEAPPIPLAVDPVDVEYLADRIPAMADQEEIGQIDRGPRGKQIQ